ncbi:unnamed protein product, partial [Polarella glacialis]
PGSGARSCAAGWLRARICVRADPWRSGGCSGRSVLRRPSPAVCRRRAEGRSGYRFDCCEARRQGPPLRIQRDPWRQNCRAGCCGAKCKSPAVCHRGRPSRPRGGAGCHGPGSLYGPAASSHGTVQRRVDVGAFHLLFHLSLL